MEETPPDFVNGQAFKYGKRCIGTTKGVVERKETPQETPQAKKLWLYIKEYQPLLAVYPDTFMTFYWYGHTSLRKFSRLIFYTVSNSANE